MSVIDLTKHFILLITDKDDRLAIFLMHTAMLIVDIYVSNANESIGLEANFRHLAIVMQNVEHSFLDVLAKTLIFSVGKCDFNIFAPILNVKITMQDSYEYYL